MFFRLQEAAIAFVFQPAIWHSDYGEDPEDAYKLPLPTAQFDISDEWKSQTHEVPRKDGGSAYGLSHRPVTISISGEFGKNASGATVDEDEMWAEYVLLRSKLDACDDDEKLELFVYYDLDSETYRKFRQVRPVSLQLSLGDSTRIVFGYSLQLIADDVQVYSTEPGAEDA